MGAGASSRQGRWSEPSARRRASRILIRPEEDANRASTWSIRLILTLDQATMQLLMAPCVDAEFLPEVGAQ